MDPPAGRSTAAYRGRRGDNASSRRVTLPKTRPFRLGATFVPDSEPELKPGAIVGAKERYAVVRFLGQGGMGRVYEAARVSDGQSAALKVLRSDRAVASSDELAARFRQEASAAGRVGHRGIVKMYGYEQTPDGRVLIAMELLRGESLEDWMSREGRLDEGLSYLADLCEALHAAHEADVLHRDIKPANLFLHREDGGEVRATVLDFGLAKVTVPDHTQIETAAGTVLGTPYYLAPERALGKPLDRRADLYSMGVVLYELLVGGLPFEADNFMAIVEGHVRHVPLDPRQAAPERPLPDAAAILAMRLLAKHPSERPQTALEIAETLREIIVSIEGAEPCPTGPRATAEPDADTQTLQGVAHKATAAETLADPPGAGEPYAATVAPSGETQGAFASRGGTHVPHVHAAASSMEAPRSRRAAWVVVGVGALLGAVGLGVWSAASSNDASSARDPAADRVPRDAVRSAPSRTDPVERPAKPPGVVLETAVPRKPVEPPAAPSGSSAENPDEVPEAEPSGDTNSAKRKRSRKSNERAPKPSDDAPSPSQPALPAFKDDVYAD